MSAAEGEDTLAQPWGYGSVDQPLDLSGVERFTFPVRSLDRAELFYAQVLGCEVVAREAVEPGGTARPARRLQACPDVVLSLVEQPYGWLPMDSSNPHWAFAIPGADVDRWVEHLGAWGVPTALVFRDDYVAEPGTPTRVEVHFLDPDGNQIELVAWDYPMNDQAARGHYNTWDLFYRYDRWPPPEQGS